MIFLIIKSSTFGVLSLNICVRVQFVSFRNVHFFHVYYNLLETQKENMYMSDAFNTKSPEEKNTNREVLP